MKSWNLGQRNIPLGDFGQKWIFLEVFLFLKHDTSKDIKMYIDQNSLKFFLGNYS